MDDSAEDADADNLFITIQIYTYRHNLFSYGETGYAFLRSSI